MVEAPVPMFGGRMSRETDVYFRLEVFTQTGSGGYDLMGLTKQQVIDDVLDRYEAHLGFLAYSSETDVASVLTPRLQQPTGTLPALGQRESADDEPRLP
jgi:choline/glycine/proline betaine transport protein